MLRFQGFYRMDADQFPKLVAEQIELLVICDDFNGDTGNSRVIGCADSETFNVIAFAGKQACNA